MANVNTEVCEQMNKILARFHTSAAFMSTRTTMIVLRRALAQYAHKQRVSMTPEVIRRGQETNDKIRRTVHTEIFC